MIVRLFLRKNVPIRILRHNDRSVYVTEKFGGKPLQEWPVFHFFQLHAQGQAQDAAEQFTNWYIEQYKRYGTVPKRAGGMQGGSLDKIVERLHWEHGKPFDSTAGTVDKDLLRHAAIERVQQRLTFLEAILTSGFRQKNHDYIGGVRQGGVIVLEGGHHRVAALMAAGHSNVPLMLVMPNKAAALLYKFCARLA